MTEYLDDVESDLSRFHRVDDIDTLDSRRFYRLAERLAYYGGAVTHIARYEQSEREAPTALQGARRIDDVNQLVALTSDSSGFELPGIEFSGG